MQCVPAHGRWVGSRWSLRSLPNPSHSRGLWLSLPDEQRKTWQNILQGLGEWRVTPFPGLDCTSQLGSEASLCSQKARKSGRYLVTQNWGHKEKYFSLRISSRICITLETCNWWDEDICVPCLGRVPVSCSWHDWIPVLFFPQGMCASEKCPVVTTASSMTYHSSCHTPFLSLGEKKTTSFSFSSIIFPEPCLKPAVRLTCVYPIQCLLLSLFLLEDQSGTLPGDGHIIATTVCSAVLNITGFRESGCLLVWASLIKKPIRNSWANPTFQFENCGDQLEKDNKDLKMFSCSFFLIKAVAAWLTESRQQ